MREIIVDNFAGGGGASEGIRMATGRDPEIAINHDPEAIRMHRVNHPGSEHYCEDVWAVDPVKAVRGRPVALAWFSPDCKHFSKAKGGKPKDKNIRGLAWVALRWAAKTRPRVIILENVEEFKTWGPLSRSHRPIKKKQGVTFQQFIRQLEGLGYRVEFRELVAADYGAPTMRKRFFLIARCDGREIIWPDATHGPRDSLPVKYGMLKPYVPAADCIDFSLPCPSIFATKEEIRQQYGINAVRPLAENTMRRIARGLKKFVLDNPDPFIVEQKCPYIMCNNENNVGGSVEDSMPTITTGNRNYLVAPALIQYHSETSRTEARGQQVDEPMMTVDGSNRYGLVSAFISKYYAGGNKEAGSDLKRPLPTVRTVECNSLAAVYLMQQQGKSTGRDLTEPLPTETMVNHFAEVRAFLIKYYGTGEGQGLQDPLDTVTAHDRFGLVKIQGVDYQIVDIGLRMLEPRELYKAQGFPESYVIDRDCDGKEIKRSEQVKRCGNAVPPPFARALVEANLPEQCGKKGRVTA